MMMLLSVLTMSGTVTYFGICIAYLPIYCRDYCASNTLQIVTLLLCMSITMPLGEIVGGLLSDLFGYKKVYFAVSVVAIISVIPIFMVLTCGSSDVLIIYGSMIFYAFMIGISLAIMMRYLTEIFPVEVRYSCVAISLNVAFAIFAGLSPVVMATLMPLFEVTLLPAYIMAMAFIVQVVALVLIERKIKR